MLNNRYQLLSKLGGGGMGDVWSADDTLLARRVALKRLVLAPGGENPDSRKTRVMQEARALAQVRHPGVVQVYDVFEEAGGPCIVMACIEGRSLQDRIDASSIGEHELARIASQVLDALTAVHAKNILHRDVKPANIMISDEGEVVLVDFGIARIDGEPQVTATGAFVGTVEFMAPERFNEGHVGPPADLWSLGVTLFYALERHSPFRRGGVPATIRAVISDDPRPTGPPGPLRDAIVKLLHKDPSRRMNTAELGLVLKSITDDPTRPTRPIRPRPVPPRRPPAAPAPPVADPAAPSKFIDLDAMDPSDAARILGAMEAAPAARRLAALPASAAHRALARVDPKAGAAILSHLPVNAAVTILAALPPKAVGDLLAAGPAGSAALLRGLPSAHSGRALDHLEADAATTLLAAMPLADAARVLAQAHVRSAADIVTALPDLPTAVRLVEAMSVRRACDVLGHMPPAITARILRASNDGRADRLVAGLGERARSQVLRHLGRA